MSRYTGPKNRLSRREGFDLGYKTVGSKSHASLLKRLNIPPGMHGQKRRSQLSGYGEQLREKQKVKRIYGVLERQFRRMFWKARKAKGNTGEKLLEYMERRLDNVLYRMALAPTRPIARQLVSHGHVFVDSEKVTIPSYLVKEGQVVNLDQKSAGIPAVKKILDDKTAQTPSWVSRKGPAGKVTRIPKREDVVEDINEQIIVEYYSR